MATTREFGPLHEWLEYDYFIRYCELNEAAVRQKLHLPHSNVKNPFESCGDRILREFSEVYGEVPRRLLSEIFRRVDFKYSFDARFLMTQKDESFRIISVGYDGVSFPRVSLPPRLRLDRYWPYVTADCQSVFGFVVSITDGQSTAKLPLTMWRYPFGNWAFDLCSWGHDFPLFRLDRIKDAEIIYICQSEEQVERAEAKYQPECERAVMFTTWPGGFDFALSRVDWGYLRGKRVVVMAEDKREEFQLALKIAKQLSKIECEFVGFKLLYYDRESTSSTLCFSNSSDVQKEMRTGVSSMPPERFARYAYEKYGIGEPAIEEFDDSVETILKEPDEPDDWVIPHLIHQRERIMVYSKPKEGKTTFMLQAAILMAHHGKKIAYFDAEMPVKTSRRLLQKACKGRGTPSNMEFISAQRRNKTLDFERPEIQSYWEDKCAKADVIILDNLNKMFHSSLGSDSNSSRELDIFIEKWWHLGKTLILVHHANQSGRQFGTGVKGYPLDLTLKVEKRKGYTKITPEEVRSLPEKYRDPFVIPYDEETGLSEDWFDPEKRYLSQKIESKKKGTQKEEPLCSPQESKGLEGAKEDIQEEKLEESPPELLEISVGSEPDEKKRKTKKTKATIKKEEDKERVRALLLENPNITVREMAEITGFSTGKAGNLMREIKAEEKSTSEQTQSS